MNKLTAIWNWFNGKKTAIGAALFGAAYVLGKVSGIWHLDAHWIAPTIDTLTEGGAILSGTGLLHKGMKAVGMADAPAAQ